MKSVCGFDLNPDYLNRIHAVDCFEDSRLVEVPARTAPAGAVVDNYGHARVQDGSQVNGVAIDVGGHKGSSNLTPCDKVGVAFWCYGLTR